MSEHDEHGEHGQWGAIEASLRRQLEPPALDGLHERIALAAAEREATESGAFSAASPEPAMESANEAHTKASYPNWLVVGIAVAAAAVLVWLLRAPPAPPGASSSGELIAHLDPDTDLGGRPHAVAEVTVASRELAGRQLHDFLGGEATLPQADLNCSTVETPVSDADTRAPYLSPDPGVRLLGECGGATEVECARYDLSAHRALWVELEPSGAKVIVCIEPPWADPRPLLPPTSEYNIFRRTLGDRVLYEVTPLTRAIAVDHLVLPPS